MDRSTVATFHAHHVNPFPVDVKSAECGVDCVKCVEVVKNARLNATHLLKPSQAQLSPSSSTQIDIAMAMDFLQWRAAQ